PGPSSGTPPGRRASPADVCRGASAPPAGRSVGVDVAAVAADLLAGQVGGGAAAQEGGDRTELRGVPVSTGGDRAPRCVAYLLGRRAAALSLRAVDGGGAVGVEPAGEQHVDGHAVGCDLAGEG